MIAGKRHYRPIKNIQIINNIFYRVIIENSCNNLQPATLPKTAQLTAIISKSAIMAGYSPFGTTPKLNRRNLFMTEKNKPAFPGELTAARVAYDEALAVWEALPGRKAEAEQTIENLKAQRAGIVQAQAETLKERAAQGANPASGQRLAELREDLEAVDFSILEAQDDLAAFPSAQLEAARALSSARHALEGETRAFAKGELEKARQRLQEAISGPLAACLALCRLAWGAHTDIDAKYILNDLSLSQVAPASLPIAAPPARDPLEVQAIIDKADAADRAKRHAEAEARINCGIQTGLPVVAQDNNEPFPKWRVGFPSEGAIKSGVGVGSGGLNVSAAAD
jgi:hypothetical protein